jgi:hypothetical protein
LPIVPTVSQRQHNFGRGKWQYLYHVSEGEKERRLRNAENSRKDPGTSEETIPEGQAGKEYRFYLLYDKIYRMDILNRAYNFVRANKGRRE